MPSAARRTRVLSACLAVELDGLSGEWGVPSDDVAAALYADLRCAHPAVRGASDAVLEMVHVSALLPSPGSYHQRVQRAWRAITVTPIGAPVRQAVRGLAFARLAGRREAGNG